MNAAETIARTALLVKLDPLRELEEQAIVDGLTAMRVRIAADRQTACCHAGQIALAACVMAVAQTGARVYLEIPEVELLGAHPALRGQDLRSALLALAGEFVQPASTEQGEVDLALLYGNVSTGATAEAMRVQADDWSAQLGAACDGGVSGRLPFGGLLAACAAAGESFRCALRLLAERTGSTVSGEHDLNPRWSITLALPPLEDAAVELGAVDAISAGAITNAVLFALLGWPELAGRIRVIDADIGEQSNLNRYALLRREHLGAAKTLTLASYSTETLQIEPVVARYDEEHLAELGPLASRVLVGVDHIPSRWLVATAAPAWVGVGATSHFEVLVSEHTASGACAACLHPHDDPGGGDIPTVCFVSQLAGYLLAYRLLASAQGGSSQPPTLAAAFNLSSPRALSSIGMPAREDCPAECEASQQLGRGARPA